MKRLICGLVALGLVAGHSGPANADYLFTTLNAFDAHGINDAGQVVGDYLLGGFLYSGGNYTTINVPTTNRLAGTTPWGINNAGQVVGSFSTGNHDFKKGPDVPTPFMRLLCAFMREPISAPGAER